MDQSRKMTAIEQADACAYDCTTALELSQKSVLEVFTEISITIAETRLQVSTLTKVANGVRDFAIGLELLLQLPKDKWDTYVYNTVATLYNKIGQFEEAIQTLRAYNGDLRTPTILATAYNGVGQFEKALETLGERPVDGWNAHYAVTAAQAYIGLDQYDKVHALFPDSKLRDFSPPVMSTKITALRAEKKYTEAISLIHEKLRTPALDKYFAVELRTNLSLLYCELEDFNAALHALPYHLSDYTTSTFNAHARILLLQRDPRKALDIILACNRPDRVTHTLHARCLNCLCLYNETINLIDSVPEKDRIPSDYNTLAVAYTAVGKPKVAQLTLKNCAQWNESTYHAAINAALALCDFSQAEILCRQVLELNLLNSVSNVLYCRFLLQRNREKDIVPLLNRYIANKGKPTHAILFCIARLSYLGINTELFTLCKRALPHLQDTLNYVMTHAAKEELSILDKEVNDAVRSGFFEELNRREGNLHPINIQTALVAANPSPESSSIHT